jgi:hypothetical protein
VSDDPLMRWAAGGVLIVMVVVSARNPWGLSMISERDGTL